MNAKHILLLILLSSPFYGQAQKTWKPWGATEAGFLAGSYGPSGDLRLQGGMKIKGWLFGGGAAYDGYKYETIPVYGQVRKMFGNRHSKPFVMGSFGANFELVDDHAYDGRIYFASPSLLSSSILPAPNYSYLPGTYSELGAGWAFRTHKKFGFNLSFSYTGKTLTEKTTSVIPNGSGAGETTTSENKYIMKRWGFRIAAQF